MVQLNPHYLEPPPAGSPPRARQRGGEPGGVTSAIHTSPLRPAISPNKSPLRPASAGGGAAGGSSSSASGSSSSTYERVRVHCRVRPILATDPPQSTVAPELLIDPRNSRVLCRGRNYGFDSVHFSGMGAGVPPPTRNDLFAAIAEPVCESVLQGFNGTILAYGQTGTGKTHTLFSTGEGLVAKAVKKLFRESRPGERVETYLSVVEL